jgi:hypothetical protein
MVGRDRMSAYARTEQYNQGIVTDISSPFTNGPTGFCLLCSYIYSDIGLSLDIRPLRAPWHSQKQRSYNQVETTSTCIPDQIPSRNTLILTISHHSRWLRSRDI